LSVNHLLDLVEKVSALSKQHPLVVGISGFGGSGKSTLAKSLANRLDAEIVSLDEFWLPENDVLSINWEVFDRARLEQQVLIPAFKEQPIRYQVFDWQQGKLGEWRSLKNTSYLIVEGISALHPNLLQYYDFKIWVDCPLELAQKRGLDRGKYEYGIDETEHWINVWAPNDRAYFEKYRPDLLADFLYQYFA
jgi:uridine kinase